MVAAILLWCIALVLAGVAWARPGDAHIRGLKLAYAHLVLILPRAIFTLMTAGFIAQIMPKETLAAWLGTGSGLGGIALASLIGAIVPGGATISFPIALVLYKSGVGVPQLIAFLTAWSVFAMHRVLAFELPLVGWGFSLVRLVVSLPLPFAAGFLALLTTSL